MVRRTSRPKPKELARLYPNIVEIEVPPLRSFGNRLRPLHTWLMLRGCSYAHWGRREGLRDFALWGFAENSDALAFREFWASVEPMDEPTAYGLSERLSALLDERRAAAAKKRMTESS